MDSGLIDGQHRNVFTAHETTDKQNVFTAHETTDKQFHSRVLFFRRG
jgi:hypothetical protein